MSNSLQPDDLTQAHPDRVSDSPMYVRYSDTVCASLMLVMQSTVHARRQLALQHPGLPPSSLPSSPPPHLHGHIPKVIGIPGGQYDILQGVVHCLMTYNSNILPRLAQPCNNSGSIPPMYVRYTDTTCTSLMLVVQSTIHTWR